MSLRSPFLETGREALVIDAIRTPIGRAHPERGAFRDTHPNTLLASCFKELVNRAAIDPAEVEDVIAGCTAPFGEQSRNIARNAWLQAGFPVEVPAITSSTSAGSIAARVTSSVRQAASSVLG